MRRKIDRVELQRARLFLIRKLDEYGFSTEDVAYTLDVDPSTLRRWTHFSRLQRRPERPNGDHELCQRIAIVLLVRGGYKVPTITRALSISQATVYRWKNYIERCYERSPDSLRNLQEYAYYIIEKSDIYYMKYEIQPRFPRGRRLGRTIKDSD